MGEKKLATKWAFAACPAWLILNGCLAALLIYKAQHVVLTAHGLEFHEIDVLFFGFSSFAVVTAFLIGALRPFRNPLKWVAWVCLALGAIVLLSERLAAIQFERTPPCWGMHSLDPGSGEGCPKGMKPNFNVQELRNYYRKGR